MINIEVTKTNQIQLKTAEKKINFFRGTLFLFISQICLMGSTYIIHFSLARLLSKAEYGQFGVILSILLICRIFLLRGVPDTIAKYVSEGRDTKSIKKKGLRLQLFFALSISTILFIFAPQLATFLNDTQLTNYIRLLSLYIPIISMIAFYVGLLNGFEKFHKTSQLLISRHILNVFFVLLLVIFGYHIYGVIAGYIFAGFFVIFLGYLTTRTNIKGQLVTLKELVYFSYSILIFSMSFTLLLSLDLFIIKNLDINNDYVGYYVAVKTLGNIPILIFAALSFTILPVISRSLSDKDMEQARQYINMSLRYCAIIIRILGKKWEKAT